MSPSFASFSTKAGSFFSSSLWKRVFSSSSDVAGLHRGDGALGGFADAVVREADMPLEHARDFGRDRLERLLRIAALRPAEMRKQDHLAALAGDLLDGRRDALDARRVGDLAVLHRHVEIDAHEHALAGDVSLIERAEVRMLMSSRHRFGGDLRHCDQRPDQDAG